MLCVVCVVCGVRFCFRGCCGVLRTPPPSDPLLFDRPKFRCFFSLPPQFSLLHPSFGGILVVFLKAVTLICARLEFSGRQGFTRQTAQEPKRAHLMAPALQKHPKFNKRTPRERRKNENCGGRGQYKSEILGGLAEGVRGGGVRGRGSVRAPKSWSHPRKQKRTPHTIHHTTHNTQHTTHNTQHTTHTHNTNWPKTDWPTMDWPKSVMTHCSYESRSLQSFSTWISDIQQSVFELHFCAESSLDCDLPVSGNHKRNLPSPTRSWTTTEVFFPHRRQRRQSL